MPGLLRAYVARVLRCVELIRVRVPLVAPFRGARAVVPHKEALLVRVETDDGTGWGECGALTDPTYAPDTLDTARVVLRDHLVPRVFAAARCDDVRGHAPARAALECALLDARLRAEGVSLAAHLGATRTRVPAGVAVGLGEDVPPGYRRVKYKVAPGHDAGTAPVAPEIAVDANGSYTPGDADDADALAELDERGLQLIEQPPKRSPCTTRVSTRTCPLSSVACWKPASGGRCCSPSRHCRASH
jgi:O-succinylbenzoate synthase